MNRQRDAAERILRPLSDLLGKPLRIATDEVVSNSDETLIRVAPGTVLSSQGNPLTSEERRLITEIREVVRWADAQEDRIKKLEQQVTHLANDNMDLAVKNQMLSEASARDSLTGLYNRWYVVDKIES